MSNIEISDLKPHLLECYLFIDDYLQSHPKVAAWRRSGSGDPDFTDAEVIAGAPTGGYFRTDTPERTYQLVIANTEGAFPDRAGYKQWIRRLRRLPDQVGRLVRAAALRGLAGEGQTLYATDSLPIPLCRLARPSPPAGRGQSEVRRGRHRMIQTKATRPSAGPGSRPKAVSPVFGADSRTGYAPDPGMDHRQACC